MNREPRTQITTWPELPRTRGAAQPPVRAVFTCTSCERTYEPSIDDFAAGRIECPDPDCGGWTFWAQLDGPGDDRPLAPGPDGGCRR